MLARLLLLLLATVGCARVQVPRTPGPGEPAIRVITFNVNYGVPPDAQTLEALERVHPDVLLVQELNTPWRDALTRWPHTALHARDEDASGFGTASVFPIEAEDVIPRTEQGWFRAQRVVLTTPLGRLQLLNVHLRPPVSDSGSFVIGYFSTRDIRQWEIASHAEELEAGLPTLIAGDFNEEDGRAVAWLEDHGWRSADRELAPGNPTWHWPGPITLHAALDHLFYGKSLEPFALKVLDAGQSDHLPVLGVFGLRR